MLSQRLHNQNGQEYGYSRISEFINLIKLKA